MTVQYLVNDTTNVIVERSESVDLVAPAGYSVVEESTITAAYTGDIYLGGTWDGTTYTLPSGILLPDDTSVDDGRLRAAVRGTHAQLFVWKDNVDREGALHAATAVALAHDFLAWAHYGIYLMVHNHRTAGNADWSVDQRVTAVQRMAFGALDVTSAYEFFATVEEDGFVGPTGPVLWVNVNTGDRVNLAQAITNTNSMHLDVDQTPNSSILNGGWINTLTA